jgi:hypothetical protein
VAQKHEITAALRKNLNIRLDLNALRGNTGMQGALGFDDARELYVEAAADTDLMERPAGNASAQAS